MRTVAIRCRRSANFLAVCVLLLMMATKASESLAAPLLQDADFSRGIRLSPFNPAAAGDNRFISRQSFRTACLPVADCSREPVWSLQQWATAQDIAAVPSTPVEAGGLEWLLLDGDQLVQKRLRLNAVEHSVAPGGSVLRLEINGKSEFAARDAGGVAHYLPDLRHSWPHFLLSQDLPGERLSTYAALPLSVSYRIPLDLRQQADGYDAGIHAARLVVSITVRNRLSGNYFWLTLPLYDDRFEYTGFGCQKCTHNGEKCYTPQSLTESGVWRCPEDRVGEQWLQNPKPGTARMIFRLPTKPFLSQQSEGWQLAEGDLLPYIQAGIEAVRDRHNGKSFPRELFFYELGRFSIGWEITGFNHVAVEWRNLQLMAVLK